MPQHERDEEQTGEVTRTERTDRTEPPWNASSCTTTGTGYPETRGFWHYQQTDYEDHVRGPHKRGKAVVNSCHKELAELYKERLRERGLTVSI